MSKTMLSWIVYAAFVTCALTLEWHDLILSFDGAAGIAKGAVWLAFLAFLVYSIYCSIQENFFRAVKSILGFHWGRQISLDLYIGLILFIGLIYLHQGSMLVAALWLLPVFLFGNLATFLYIVIHFESIVARFIS